MQIKTSALISFFTLALAAIQPGIAAPSPDQEYAASLVRLVTQLYSKSRSPSGGTAIDEWSTQHGWMKAPIPGTGLLRNSTQFVGEWNGHRALIGHDDTRGAVFVATFDKSIEVDAVLNELRNSFAVTAFNTHDIPDAKGAPDFSDRSFFGAEGGRETTYIEIQTAVPGSSKTFTMIGLAPSELIRRELRAGPPVQK